MAFMQIFNCESYTNNSLQEESTSSSLLLFMMMFFFCVFVSLFVFAFIYLYLLRHTYDYILYIWIRQITLLQGIQISHKFIDFCTMMHWITVRVFLLWVWCVSVCRCVCTYELFLYNKRISMNALWIFHKAHK